MEGRLAAPERAALEEHLATCSACHDVMARVAAGLFAGSTDGGPTEDGSNAGPSGWRIHRGTSVGRYVITGIVGAGAMGVVYAAYDPELNRKVAIKLCNSEEAAGRSEDRQRRLLREAQAMARLSHPHVVAVHDAGLWRNDIFVAMEFVEGRNLRDWLSERQPTWREILRIFDQAGQGLAAAHAAGIVHRDFKPQNVLVDARASAKVTDFGLARAEHSSEEATGASAPAPSPEPVGARGLTHTGALLGTPAYMSPEQIRGGRSTFSSDQFSFCVALYEALYGQRPFEGHDLAALREAVLSGRLREAPSPPLVPAWVRRAVLRGLQPDPDARFPSMEALLAALGNNPARTWRRLGVGAAALGLVASALVTALGWNPFSPPPARARRT